MSLVERLFPASELKALRSYTYSGQASRKYDSGARATKRRRLSSKDSVATVSTHVLDSGYNTADDIGSQGSPVASETTIDGKLENPPAMGTAINTDSQKRRRGNSEPMLSSGVEPLLVQRYLSRMHPSDRQRYTAVQPFQDGPSTTDSTMICDADLEILSAQRQIALARKRLHSYSGPSTTTQKSHTDLGEAPKTTSSSDLLSWFIEGSRVMTHERNLLSSLVGPLEAANEPKQASKVELTAEERHEVEKEVTFAGLTMPANLDDDEPENQPRAYQEETRSDLEDFFKLDEASTPTEEARP